MLIDFPANPRIDQTYFINDRYWTWNGVAWRVYNITPRQVPNVSWVDAGGANDTEALVGVNKTASTVILDGYTLNSPTINSGEIVSSTISSTSIGSATISNSVIGSSTANGLILNSSVLNNGYTEEVYAIQDAAGVALTPTNGSIQTWVLGASRTPTQGTWDSGQSMTLMIDDGSAFTVTWSSVPVTWVGNAVPALATTGYTVLEFWKVNTVVYGTLVGYV